MAQRNDGLWIHSLWARNLVVILLLTTGGWLLAEQAKLKMAVPSAPAASTGLWATPTYIQPENKDEQSVAAILDQRVDIEFKRVPAEKALTELARKYKLNLVQRWDQIEREYPDARTREVALSLKQVTLRRALELTLAAIDSRDPLSYIIEDNVLIVGLKERLNGVLIVKYYDISELVSVQQYAPIGDAVNTPLDMPIPALALKADGKVEVGGSLFSCTSSYPKETHDTPLTRSERSLRYVEAIRQTVANDSWYPNGVGTIHESNGTLIVSQTHENHRAIRSFLENMRKVNAHQMTRKPVLIEAWWICGNKVDPATLAKIKNPKTVLTDAELGKLPLFSSAAGRGTHRIPMTVSSGKGQLLLTHVKSSASQEAVRTDARRYNVFFGSLLNITPRLHANQKTVNVKIRSVVCELTEVEEKKVQTAIPSTQPTVTTVELDLPRYTVAQFRTETVLPLNQPVYMGGFTATASNGDTNNDENDQKALPLFLLLRVTTP